MNYRIGDVWEMPGIRYICVPINGTLKGNGALVMGKGLAEQAKNKCSNLDSIAGRMVAEYGLRVMIVGTEWNHRIILFPTKYKWNDAKASTSLIGVSCMELEILAKSMPDCTIALPRPGCGVGQLSWVYEVEPIVNRLLSSSNNVIVVTK